MAPDNPVVLVVEDVEQVRRMTLRLLRHGGFQDVVEAESAEAALDLLASGKRFDLVLADLKLPGIDGVELVLRLRVTLPQLKVVFMSGLSDVDLRESVEMLEGSHFIRKPFTPEDLVAVVRAALES